MCIIDRAGITGEKRQAFNMCMTPQQYKFSVNTIIIQYYIQLVPSLYPEPHQSSLQKDMFTGSHSHGPLYKSQFRGQLF